MDIDFSPTKPLESVQQTNVLLRSIWARLRADFGFALQYTPRRDSRNHIQHIGYFGLNKYSQILRAHGIYEPGSCFFRYKQRGIVDSFILSVPPSWSACLNISEISRSIKISLSNAEKFNINKSKFYINIYSHKEVQFPSISGEYFNFAGRTGQATLAFDISHYDDVDYEEQGANLAWNFCILGSAWTGNLLFLDHSQTAIVEYSQVLSLILDGDFDGSVSKLTNQHFSALIDLMISGSARVNSILKAGHLIQRSIFSASCSQTLLGDTANALSISALEVLSDDGSDPEICRSCGQPRYKISQRLREYAAKQMGADFWRKWFGEKYATRSKFLHTGAIQHRQVLTGKTNPTVQLSAPEGMAMPMVFAYDHVLTYFTLEIFRNHVEAFIQNS